MFRRHPEFPGLSEVSTAIDDERGIELKPLKVGPEGETVFRLRFRNDESTFVALYEPSTEDGETVVGWTVMSLPPSMAEAARRNGVDDLRQTVDEALRTFASFGRRPVRVSRVTFAGRAPL